MKIGYARVSDKHQDLELQIEALTKAGCAQIYSEKFTGKDNHNRKELQAMLATLREDDTIIIYKVDRIARSLRGLIELMDIFNAKKVNLISLDSGDKIDTTSPMGKACLQMAGVFAELEREMINSRTLEGIKRAQANGVKFGRKPGSRLPGTEEKYAKARAFIKAGMGMTWIKKELGMSSATVAQLRKDLINASTL